MSLRLFRCQDSSVSLSRPVGRDTDSVIYIQSKDEPNLIETGAKLGDMTSELRSTGYISQFVNGVSKNYAFNVIVT